ncbi:hypothetical protein GCM10027062_14920 [Nocardioides hungaricus]
MRALLLCGGICGEVVLLHGEGNKRFEPWRLLARAKARSTDNALPSTVSGPAPLGSGRGECIDLPLLVRATLVSAGSPGLTLLDPDGAYCSFARLPAAGRR